MKLSLTTMLASAAIFLGSFAASSAAVASVCQAGTVGVCYTTECSNGWCTEWRCDTRGCTKVRVYRDVRIEN